MAIIQNQQDDKQLTTGENSESKNYDIPKIFRQDGRGKKRKPTVRKGYENKLKDYEARHHINKNDIYSENVKKCQEKGAVANLKNHHSNTYHMNYLSKNTSVEIEALHRLVDTLGIATVARELLSRSDEDHLAIAEAVREFHVEASHAAMLPSCDHGSTSKWPHQLPADAPRAPSMLPVSALSEEEKARRRDRLNRNQQNYRARLKLKKSVDIA